MRLVLKFAAAVLSLSALGSALLGPSASAQPAQTQPNITNVVIPSGLVAGTPFVVPSSGNNPVAWSGGALGSAAAINVPISLANGGTAASLTANNGGVVVSGPSTLAVVSYPGSAGLCLLSGQPPTWNSCSGSTGVASLGNYTSDTTLNITGTGSGPWTGAVTVELNLANVNTWSGAQTFNSGKLIINGGSATAGIASVTSAGVVSSETFASACTAATASTFGCVKGDNATLSLSAGVISINLANANTWTAAIAENQANIGTTSTDGLVAENTQAAASGAQQWSPRIRFTGYGWKTASTAASQEVDFIVENQTIQGTSAPTGNLVWSSQIAGGGYSALMALSAAGGLGIGTTTTEGAGTVNLVSGGAYYINGSSVLNGSTLGTGVTASSLTSVGTLTSGATGSGFTVALGTSTITGTLGTTNGGTGTTSAGTQYGVVYYSTTTAMASTVAGTTSGVLQGNASGAPTWVTTLSSTLQGNITTTGTVTSGTWEGAFGGTITGNATLSGNLTFSGTDTASGVWDFSNTTQSTSTSSGALYTAGGIGAAKNINSGGNINVTSLSNQFQMNGQPILWAPGGFQNLSVGYVTNATSSWTGTYNIAIGNTAGASAISGENNLMIGPSAGSSITSGSGNFALGANALTAVTSASNNVAVGVYSQENATGADNTAIGYSTMLGVTGDENTAIGLNAGENLTSGAQNVFLGQNSGASITTGSYNTIVGYYTGTTALSSIIVLADGSGNVRYDYGVTNSGGTTLAGGIYLPGLSSAGGTDILCYNSTGGVVTYETSVLGCVPSAERFKNLGAPLQDSDLIHLASALDSVEPWTYKKDLKLGDDQYIGFTADQVERIDPRFVGYQDGKLWGVKHQQLSEAMLAGLSLELNELKAQFATYRAAHP